jgi:hypothetical protein
VAAVKLGRKLFRTDCDVEVIDCVGCDVSAADMAVFAARIKRGEFSRAKKLILVSFLPVQFLLYCSLLRISSL